VDFKEIFYPETKFGGFSEIDGTIAFYSRVNALLTPNDIVLDIGCGRARFQDDTVRFRRELRVIKGKVERVVGIDITKESEKNPYLDEFRLLEDDSWPAADNEFDLCICDWVIEHIMNPELFFSEAARVVRPGGYLCIRTSNKYGYARVITQIIPNRFHATVLSKVQHGRKEEDVFPVYNKCNTKKIMRSHLDQVGFDHVVYTHESEPAYLNFSRFVYMLGVLYHKIIPSPLKSTLFVFARNQ